MVSCAISTRVPIGSSRLTPRRPSSEVGKNSEPINLVSDIEPMKIATQMSMVTVLWRTTLFSKKAYPLSSASSARSIGLKIIVNSLPCLGLSRSHWLQSIGVSERAHVVEIIIMIHTIQPSWRNSTPDIPLTSVSGKNTAISVSVEAITEIATSLVPCTAACFGSEPRSMCVVTFSSTTMASSTTIPIDMESAESDTMLSVLPVPNR